MKIADLKKDIILNAGVRHFDFTASGLGLESVEREVKKVLKSYANTHSDSSLNSFKTQKFYEDAREFIKKSLNLSEDFALIAVGTGSSGAIKKFQELLGIYAPPRLKANFLSQIPKKSLPIVIIGPYEHHSIELSFREGMCECVRIPLDKNGEIDFQAFESTINSARKADKTRQIIVSFSLASNVTGIITDYKRLWRIAKSCDALVAFDGASLLPYDNAQCEFYDALFISPHKFIGGVGSCGLLVVRKSLLGEVPSFAAGGTVGYVSRTSAQYLCDIEKLEEAGTPGILQLVRAAAAFKVRDKIGLTTIKKRENALKNYFFQKAAEFNAEFAKNSPEQPSLRGDLSPKRFKRSGFRVSENELRVRKHEVKSTSLNSANLTEKLKTATALNSAENSAENLNENSSFAIPNQASVQPSLRGSATALTKQSTSLNSANLAKNSAKNQSEILTLYAANLRNRLPIFALNVAGISPFDLAYHLSKYYKIETRAGCACAGPYGHDLLGLKDSEIPKPNSNANSAPNSKNLALKNNQNSKNLSTKNANLKNKNSSNLNENLISKNDLNLTNNQNSNDLNLENNSNSNENLTSKNVNSKNDLNSASQNKNDFLAIRPAWLRVSLHYTHEKSDIDYFFEALKKCVCKLAR